MLSSKIILQNVGKQCKRTDLKVGSVFRYVSSGTSSNDGRKYVAMGRNDDFVFGFRLDGHTPLHAFATVTPRSHSTGKDVMVIGYGQMTITILDTPKILMLTEDYLKNTVNCPVISVKDKLDDKGRPHLFLLFDKHQSYPNKVFAMQLTRQLGDELVADGYDDAHDRIVEIASGSVVALRGQAMFSVIEGRE
tara:strand:+ start:212 stop:787 length:576 start_codon:yes stop_codon:yes gene_type:complete